MQVSGKHMIWKFCSGPISVYRSKNNLFFQTEYSKTDLEMANGNTHYEHKCPIFSNLSFIPKMFSTLCSTCFGHNCLFHTFSVYFPWSLHQEMFKFPPGLEFTNDVWSYHSNSVVMVSQDEFSHIWFVSCFN